MAVTDSDLDPQGPKNGHNILMTLRKMIWPCDYVAEIIMQIYFVL